MRLLLLGGTSEASALAAALAGMPDISTTLSLAGRTRMPAPQPVPLRVGGFGGVPGLAAWLGENRADLLVDATHPFAIQISANARAAAIRAGVPLLVLQRPAWQPIAGDHWLDAADMVEAAGLLGRTPRRVLLTVGRQDLAPFAAAPWHDYLVRSVDAPPADALPPRAVAIAARGPFAEADEERLMRDRRIDIVVTKNAGGLATAGKLAAARTLGLPVVMVGRPASPAPSHAATVETVAEALEAIRHHASARGV